MTKSAGTAHGIRIVLCAMLLVLGEGVFSPLAADWPTSSIPSVGARVPILVYHAIDESGITYSTTPAQLDAHCRWLVAHGYTAITVRRFWRAAQGKADLPLNPIVLTNDDGGPTALAFARILRRHGLVGTYFVNNVSPLTPRQIRALDRWGEVEAHTVSHVALNGLDYRRQMTEIVENAVYLQRITGNPVRFLAWPYGVKDESATIAAAEAGITAAFALGGARADLHAIDPYAVPRISIVADDTMTTFAAKVRGE